MRVADRKKQDSFVIALRNRDYPDASIDLTELALGAPETKTGSGAYIWSGGFTGRPGLLGDLMPGLTASLHGRSRRNAQSILTALRSFWRYLDAREAHFASQGIARPRVEHLRQITGVIFEAWLQPGPDGAWAQAAVAYGKNLRPIIEQALHDHDLDELHTGAIPARERIPKDTASDEEGISLIRYLRSRCLSILQRWRNADVLAAQGRDLVALHRRAGHKGIKAWGEVTESDLHSTYRALATSIGIPAPELAELWSSLGYSATKNKRPGWWPQNVALDDISTGLYPSSREVSIFALAATARLAWNPATLLNLDVNYWCSDYDEDHVWMFSVKARTGSYQHGVSDRRKPSSAYQLVTRLIERSAPLRDWIAQNPEAHPLSTRALRSPWVGLSRKPGELLFVGDPETTDTLNAWLRHCIHEHNQQPGAIQVRDMGVSDFRDVAAAVMYRDSRYSLWLMQLLLGHRNQGTTTAYGFRHATRQETHRQVLRVVEAALDQAREDGAIDPTLIRAKIEGVEITPEGVARLNAYRATRTYAGANCIDPTSPPKEIDPTHPRDGKTKCVFGHLCVAKACPRAIVLKDSVDRIARSAAEYEWRRERLGGVRWTNSSAEAELQRLRETLRQWPEEEVDTRIRYWREQIASGKHEPLMFGGSHGKG